jgi:hypothetical protein
MLIFNDKGHRITIATFTSAKAGRALSVLSRASKSKKQNKKTAFPYLFIFGALRCTLNARPALRPRVASRNNLFQRGIRCII